MQKEVTVEELRDNLVPIMRDFKSGFSKVDKYNGERLALLVNWESRQLFATILKGPCIPPRVQQGLDETFNTNFMIPRDIPFYDDPENHILNAAYKAQVTLLELSVVTELSDEMKAEFREILEPYRQQYEQT